MTVRRLDANGDIATSGTQFITERAEIAQTVRTRLGLFLGEYFRDITDGTPWFQSVFSKQTSLSSKEAAIRNRIIRTNGVQSLTRFETDYDITTRKYSVNVGILTQYGEEDLNIIGGF